MIAWHKVHGCEESAGATQSALAQAYRKPDLVAEHTTQGCSCQASPSQGLARPGFKQLNANNL